MLKCARIKCKISHKSPHLIISISLCIFYYIYLTKILLSSLLLLLHITFSIYYIFYLLYYLFLYISSITLLNFSNTHFYISLFLFHNHSSIHMLPFLINIFLLYSLHLPLKSLRIFHGLFHNLLLIYP